MLVVRGSDAPPQPTRNSQGLLQIVQLKYGVIISMLVKLNKSFKNFSKPSQYVTRGAWLAILQYHT